MIDAAHSLFNNSVGSLSEDPRRMGPEPRLLGRDALQGQETGTIAAQEDSEEAVYHFFPTELSANDQATILDGQTLIGSDPQGTVGSLMNGRTNIARWVIEEWRRRAAEEAEEEIRRYRKALVELLT
jgi:hypothetical protein